MNSSKLFCSRMNDLSKRKWIKALSVEPLKVLSFIQYFDFVQYKFYNHIKIRLQYTKITVICLKKY